MRASLALRRVQLETDRLVRAREFFGRAICGHLEVPHYVDLLTQLASLLCGAGRSDAHRLLGLAAHDVGVLSSRLHEPLEAGPCPAVCLFAEALERTRGPYALEATVAVVGTSWCSDAAEHASRRFPGANTFLTDLAERGRGSLRRLENVLDASDETQQILAHSELTRGAFLGLATYLDTTWPAPVFTVAVLDGDLS